MPKEIYAVSRISQNAEIEQQLDGTISNLEQIPLKMISRKILSTDSLIIPKSTGRILSERGINGLFRRLTSDERNEVLIIDDSLFDRSISKKTEMLVKVFDYCSMKYKKGLRLLTLGWSDGNSFVPINHCLLSAVKDENFFCVSKQYDGRFSCWQTQKTVTKKSNGCYA